ncbi:MAG: wax ester/triacylglycerol synthase domain-containing protein [Acidimicrobiales bacterium]
MTIAGGAEAAGRPLEPEDLAILALENDTIVGHVCKVVVTRGPVGRRELLERLERRLALAPLLTTRLDAPEGGRAWVLDPRFDLSLHVTEHGGPGPVDRAGLLEAVAAVFEQHLDRSRPLWHMTTVDLDDGGTALIWRIHHALADGATGNRLADLLLWDRDDPEPVAGGGGEGEGEGVMTPALAAAHEADDARRRLHLAGLVRREYARQHGRSPFDGVVGRRRAMGLASAPLGTLHRAARAVDRATVNDALLAVVAGALRRWIEEQHGAVRDLRVRVPVSMHHEGDDASNRDSYFFVDLPVHVADPVERLRYVRRETAVRKTSRDAEELEQLHRELAAVPHLRSLVARIEDSPRRFAVCVSNVPGPKKPVAVLSRPVSGLFGFAEIGLHHALRITADSDADRIFFGFCADPDLVPEVQAMAEAAEAEAAALIAATEPAAATSPP